MNKQYVCHHHSPQKKNGTQRGPSSYAMQNPNLVFSALNLKKGDIFFDIGCGQGDYSLAAAKIVGSSGRVYAIDKWSNLTNGLQKDASEKKLNNIRTITADISKKLPMPDQQVDLCLLGTILHATTLKIIEQGLAVEIQRILKPEGKVAILECKKEEQPFGPPIERRLSPEQVRKTFSQQGFKELTYLDLGYNYLLIFANKT